jgi:hypothetical protein
MANILVSSATAPMSSVIMCCTAETTLNMLSRGRLLTLGAETDYLFPADACLLSAGSSSDLPLPRGVLRFPTAKDNAGVMKFKENTIPVVFLGMTAATVVGRTCWLTFGHLAVAARQHWGGIPILWVVFVQVAATTPQAARRLLAICPDVGKLLAIIALGKGMLRYVCLGFYRYVPTRREFKNFLALYRSWQVMRYNGRIIGASAEDRRVDDIC